MGRIGRPHGVRGEVTVLPDTADDRRFAAGSHLLTSEGFTLVVRAARPYRDKGLVVAFEGVPDRSAAEELRGLDLMVTADDRRALATGEWWVDDLVGLAAVSPTGEPLGEITGVELGTGQDRLVVATPRGDVLVPFVEQIVSDPADGKVVIDAPEGLFE